MSIEECYTPTMRQQDYSNIDEYISLFTEDVQELLQEIREVIRSAAPRAEEDISYGIPTFTLNGNLVHFGGFRHHIGFYPGPSGMRKYLKELAKYKHSKGSVQFPLDEDLPVDLIKKIVTFRVGENMAKKKEKKR